MNLINLLIELASTPVEQSQVNMLLATQPDSIQQAFLTQNANAVKQLLMMNQTDSFANERAVAQI